MAALGITEIHHKIVSSNKGDLNLVLRKGEDDYFFTLDAVPCTKEVNEKLMDVFFNKEPIPEVTLTPSIIKNVKK